MNKESFPRMHVSLYVKDIDKTVLFYNQFFNQKPEKVKSDYAKYILDQPSLIISFVKNKDRVKENFGHLGFQVESKEKLDFWLESTKSKGIEMLEEMGTNCCYASQDKFWVTDPDGVKWEIYLFHDDVEFNDPHYNDLNSDVCCVPPNQEKKKLKLADLNDEQSCDPASGCC